MASLKQLNKNDVVEVRAMQRPPDGVKMVIEAVCIMKGSQTKESRWREGMFVHVFFLYFLNLPIFT